MGLHTIFPKPTKVTMNNNSPVRLEEDFETYDAEGNKYGLAGGTVISLCRWGKSENKPFCDGGHRAAGIESQRGAGIAGAETEDLNR